MDNLTPCPSSNFAVTLYVPGPNGGEPAVPEKRGRVTVTPDLVEVETVPEAELGPEYDHFALPEQSAVIVADIGSPTCKGPLGSDKDTAHCEVVVDETVVDVLAVDDVLVVLAKEDVLAVLFEVAVEVVLEETVDDAEVVDSVFVELLEVIVDVEVVAEVVIEAVVVDVV